MSRMLVFDDREWGGGRAGADLGPMTDLRATFEVRTGMLTTLERLAREWSGPLAGVWVPESLREVVAERSDVPVNEPPAEGTLWLANGRWTYPAAKFELGPGEALVEETGDVVAAHLEARDASAFLKAGTLPEGVERVAYSGRLMVRRPWEVLAQLPTTLTTDLMSLCARHNAGTGDQLGQAARETGVTAFGEEPVWIAPSARVYPSAVLDAEKGPIVIDEGAAVRPQAVIAGPAYVGRDSTVLDQALVKANTSIGPVCKVAGEVGATIFQGYANKGHDGHLGDSWVGEWANLGAATTNSNLLNTYGEVMVRLRPDGPRERSGMMFLGALIGDHVKTAIGTKLMTGTVLGTGAMIASTAAPPTTVGAFAWITDAGTKRYRLDKFLEVARTVMARRHVEMSPAMERRLRDLFERTATERTGE